MKFLIPFIILIAIFQSAFFPANLILTFIIAKSYTHSENSNYFLAVVGGLSIGLLQSTNIGIQTLILVVAVFLTHLYRKTPLSANLFFFIPFCFFLIFVLNFSQALLLIGLVDWTVIVFESILCILIFSLIRALGLIGRGHDGLRLKL